MCNYSGQPIGFLPTHFQSIPHSAHYPCYIAVNELLQPWKDFDTEKWWVIRLMSKRSSASFRLIRGSETCHVAVSVTLAKLGLTICHEVKGALERSFNIIRDESFPSQHSQDSHNQPQVWTLAIMHILFTGARIPFLAVPQFLWPALWQIDWPLMSRAIIHGALSASTTDECSRPIHQIHVLPSNQQCQIYKSWATGLWWGWG